MAGQMAPAGPGSEAVKRPRCLSVCADSCTIDQNARPQQDAIADSCCWICLASVESGPLVQPCKCPRSAHPRCLARWQLQSAGSRRETHCEFCDSQLPDWKTILTARCGASAPAVMNVNFAGQTFSFEVKPGPDGYQRFTDAIRRAFTLPEDAELNISYTVDEPGISPTIEPVHAHPPPIITNAAAQAASLLTLQGPGAYDAAVHCASVSATRRMMHAPPDAACPHRGQSLPSPGSVEGVPVRRTLSEPPAPLASSSATQTDASSQPAASNGQPGSKGSRKLRTIGKGINSLITKVFHHKGDSSSSGAGPAQDPAMEQE